MAIGDFGCGEGKLQKRIEEAWGWKSDKEANWGRVWSFDAGRMQGKEYEHVIQCDISKVPLAALTLDIAVFCLSLMGTNFPQFLLEANRVLKMGGKLFVAEVLSRFENVHEFAEKYMSMAGFKCLKINRLKDFFYIMVFKKI